MVMSGKTTTDSGGCRPHPQAQSIQGLPIVSIVVPFSGLWLVGNGGMGTIIRIITTILPFPTNQRQVFGLNQFLTLRSPKGYPQKGTTMETIGRNPNLRSKVPSRSPQCRQKRNSCRAENVSGIGSRKTTVIASCRPET